MVENESIIAIGERRNALIDEYFYPFSLFICKQMLNFDIFLKKSCEKFGVCVESVYFCIRFSGLVPVERVL